MKKIILTFLIYAFLILGYLINGSIVLAKNTDIQEKLDQLESKNIITEEDERVIKIRNALKGFPLENSALDFVRTADKYNLGKHSFLVAAISGVESTFGQFIPYNSYNAWGFGIPTGAQSGIVFNSWKDGIEEVTRSLRNEKHYLKDITDLNELTSEELVYKIGPVYAASPTWAQKVLYFMNKIENSSATPSSAKALSPSF